MYVVYDSNIKSVYIIYIYLVDSSYKFVLD